MLSKIARRTTAAAARIHVRARHTPTQTTNVPKTMDSKDGSCITTWWPVVQNKTTVSGATSRRDEELKRIQTFKGHYQPKLDGWRVRVDLHTCTMYTRSGEPLYLTEDSDLYENLRFLRENANSAANFQFVDGELMHSDGRDRL